MGRGGLGAPSQTGGNPGGPPDTQGVPAWARPGMSGGPPRGGPIEEPKRRAGKHRSAPWAFARGAETLIFCMYG